MKLMMKQPQLLRNGKIKRKVDLCLTKPNIIGSKR